MLPQLFRTTINGLKINKGRIFPIGGISNAITIGNNEAGYFPNMITDKYGFHNQKDLYKRDEGLF